MIRESLSKREAEVQNGFRLRGLREVSRVEALSDGVFAFAITLLHALLSLRDRSEPEKRAWRELFEYYVFGPADLAGRHLPEAARGNLGPMDDVRARRLRALVLSRLNR